MSASAELHRIAAALAGRYVVEREIGRGGIATVYLARDRAHDRPVAVKVLRPELDATLGPDRFLREIGVLARLTHPHILPILDSGAAHGVVYYVMPFVAGESLRSRLEREGQLPLEDALRIGGQLLEALAHAHASGVIHRDVKPENILFSHGQVLLGCGAPPGRGCPAIPSFSTIAGSTRSEATARSSPSWASRNASGSTSAGRSEPLPAAPPSG